MSKKWIFLTCVLSLGSIETSQAHPLDSRDIVYIDGVPCNRACQSYMAWSRQTLAKAGYQAPAQHRQRPAVAAVHRVARQSVPLPPSRAAMLQPADNTAGKPATEPAQQPTPAPTAAPAEQKSDHDGAAVAGRPESLPPGDAGKAASTPPQEAARPEKSANVTAESSTGTIAEQMVAALHDAEQADSGSPGNSDELVAVLVARPEINAVSDLAGRDIALDDKYSASSDKVRTAIAAAGAPEVKISEGQAKAIDRLIGGEVPAAVLTLLSPETGFPQFAGFSIFRIPLGSRSPAARL